MTTKIVSHDSLGLDDPFIETAKRPRDAGMIGGRFAADKFEAAAAGGAGDVRQRRVSCPPLEYFGARIAIL